MTQTQKRTDLIMEILTTHFPIECDMVGTSNLFNIANGISKEARSTGGSNFDITAPLSVLVLSVGFINNAINIYNTFKKGKMPVPAAPEFKIIVENHINVANDATNNNTINVTNDITNDAKLDICQSLIDLLPTRPLTHHPANE